MGNAKKKLKKTETNGSSAGGGGAGGAEEGGAVKSMGIAKPVGKLKLEPNTESGGSTKAPGMERIGSARSDKDGSHVNGEGANGIRRNGHGGGMMSPESIVAAF